jgi:hypothetical protein
LINAFIDSDDDFYDKVASDEDYTSLNHHEQQKRMKMNKKSRKVGLFKDYLFLIFYFLGISVIQR